MSPPKSSKDATEGGIKIVSDNRKASHNYFLEERYEAGMVLTGTEVKSLRDGKANLADSYAMFRGRELFLINAHITEYKQGNINNHEPTRTRKLLLNTAELNKLWGKLEIKGYSLIPTKLYFKNGKAKVEIAVGRGKKAFDKRASEKEKEVKRDLAKVMKHKQR